MGRKFDMSDSAKKASGCGVHYRDVPLSDWSEKLLGAGVPAHIVKHLSVMTELNKQGRYAV